MEYFQNFQNLSLSLSPQKIFLKSREDLFDIYIQPITWGKTGWVWKDDELRQWIDHRIKETAVLLQSKQLQPDISLQITIPNEFEKMCPINIGYTAGIETNKCSPQWLPKCNEMDSISSKNAAVSCNSLLVLTSRNNMVCRNNKQQ